MLNFVKTPSGKNIDKNTIKRRSMEVINRRSLVESVANRRSLIDSSTNRISFPSQRDSDVRTAKSMEFINKKESFRSELPSPDVDLTGFKRLDTYDGGRTSPMKNTNHGSGNRDPKVNATAGARPPSLDTGTLKSDAATMTDVIMPPSSYDRQRNESKSKDDVMAWLENCEENDSEVKDSDSDYSSSFYKTSRSSSMTDMNNPGRFNTASTSSYADTGTGGGNRKSTEKEILGEKVFVIFNSISCWNCIKCCWYF